MIEPTVSDLSIVPKLRIKWPTLLVIGLLHLGLVFAPMTFAWSAFGVFLALQWITGGLGITLGYHRLLTHRSFHAPKWLEYALTLCGSLALQNGPIKWVATHRVHHAYTDRPQDPHSPTRGFWWAHAFWLFAYDEVLDDPTRYERFVPELVRDPVHRFISRTDVWQQAILALLLFAAGGWPFVVWGVVVRLVFVYHITWLVNSAAHVWGYRTYETGEGSRNNWWVALLSFGEGWHNNHHAYPYSAAHGLRWWEFDLTYATIRLLVLVRLAKSVHLPRGNPTQLPSIAMSRPGKRRHTRRPTLGQRRKAWSVLTEDNVEKPAGVRRPFQDTAHKENGHAA